MSNPARTVPLPLRAGWRDTTVLLAASALVPFLVHLLPWWGHRPLGVYVLPVFWTTFVAVYFRGALVGLAVGLVTPVINLLLTGLPVSTDIGSMVLEVAGFVPLAALLVARGPGCWFWAPAAWIAAKAVALTAQYFIPVFHETENPLLHLIRSTENGIVGLTVLAVINALLVGFYPKPDAWELE
jgi:hypothetical protein